MQQKHNACDSSDSFKEIQNTRNMHSESQLSSEFVQKCTKICKCGIFTGVKIDPLALNHLFDPISRSRKWK